MSLRHFHHGQCQKTTASTLSQQRVEAGWAGARVETRVEPRVDWDEAEFAELTLGVQGWADFGLTL